MYVHTLTYYTSNKRRRYSRVFCIIRCLVKAQLTLEMRPL